MAPGPDLDLSGSWRAAPADDDQLRRRIADDELDDSGWEAVAVPGHWRSVPAFADRSGPVLYRTRFRTPDSPTAPWGDDEHRSFVVLDGVFAASDVWLDGAYLGDTSGYLQPHAFEVTDTLRRRDDHLLALEVTCGEVGAGLTRDLTGAFGRSALMGAGHDPGGIWRPVRLHRTGPVQMRFSRLRCPRADAERATLALRVVVDTAEPRRVVLRTSIRPATDGIDATAGPGATIDAPIVVERDQDLATGENRVEWTVDVPRPELWWPRALGAQPLYDVTVEVVLDDRVSDARSWRTGLRQVSLDDFVCRVNGERLFLKGLAVGPTRLLPAEATAEEVAADIDRAVDAGLDLLRVHGHVARPELYAAADAAGILLWQDLPLQWGLQRSAKAPARRLARAAVDLLAHHPSIAVWCAHHEPWVGDPATTRTEGPRATRRRRLRTVAAHALPSWNRTVLDRSVALVLRESDGSRPVVAHSGVWPHPPQLSGTSTHLWAGWRWGGIDDLPRLLRWWPRLGRFVAEFGAQAPAPDDAHLATAGPWPDLDWPALATESGLEPRPARAAAPPERHATSEAWAEALRAHQAELVRSHVEALRRLKYRPTGGFAAFALADPGPGITAALLDHHRRPKPAWDAFVEACRPLVAVVDRPPEALAPGQRHRLEVHVVNDHRRPMAELRVGTTATWEGSGGTDVVRQGWEGDVDADTVTRVGEIRLDVPDDARSLVLDVVLTGPGGLEVRRRHRRDVHLPV
ncbi:hypothetical protein [Rhabdothermincola salaria]|uniref:hypothetical protein n=1 Tax=Rhabdothermincola salaria TaxID=2903142 RepID=UPI001E496D02|nr:hypothetical protein [Rhabdothermincola salaria]MCD9625572.1 hypothetical protein [Rhabdothermincola salaria]